LDADTESEKEKEKKVDEKTQRNFFYQNVFSTKSGVVQFFMPLPQDLTDFYSVVHLKGSLHQKAMAATKSIAERILSFYFQLFCGKSYIHFVVYKSK